MSSGVRIDEESARAGCPSLYAAPRGETAGREEDEGVGDEGIACREGVSGEEGGTGGQRWDIKLRLVSNDGILVK